jgi:hypothetical protein
MVFCSCSNIIGAMKSCRTKKRQGMGSHERSAYRLWWDLQERDCFLNLSVNGV